jgi:competence protein ComEA
MNHSIRVLFLACIAAITLAAQGTATAPAKKASPTAKKSDATTKPAATSGDAAAKVGIIDINTASAEELKQVPGIGDAYSAKIVAGRPYRAKNELVSKGILPEGVYAKVKDHLVAKGGGSTAKGTAAKK